MSPGEVKNVDQAIATVVTAATDQVGLPGVDYLSLWLYETTEAFKYWGGWRYDATHLDDIAAFTSGRDIHVNLEKLAKRPWDDQIAILAHEYGHAVHSVLGRPRVKTAVWFEEGFAEWVQSKVLDSLMWRNAEAAVRRARRELNYHRSFELSVLEDDASWTNQRRKAGGFVKTYVLAFMAVDQLIETKGLPAAVEYLRTGKFEESFGEPQDKFEAAFEKSVQELHRAGSGDFDLRKPQWKIGFQWSYAETRFGKARTITKKIIREDTNSGTPLWVVSVGPEEETYSKETLGIFEAKERKLTNTPENTRSEFLAWPLQAGKEWKYTTREIVKPERGYSGDQMMLVPGMEEINVPAGTFKAVKIEAYDRHSGRLQAEYWYSPNAKWFVKSVFYGLLDTYFREQQLVSFKLEG